MSKLTKQQKKLIFLSSIGGLLEFYDFIIYALFAGYLAQNFFPLHNHVTSLIFTFATFAIGYLIRPLGGVIFGHFGDKSGRKTTFTITVFMMAISTFLIGVLPTYHQVGILAPILLILMRMGQGFSVGGEVPGAITYLSETAEKHKGFACGIIFCALVSGIVLGLAVNTLLNAVFTQADIIDWAWRLPFFLGGILGTTSYFLRRRFYESPLFKSIQDDLSHFPMVESFQSYFHPLAKGFFLVAMGSSITTLLFLFTPSYLTKVLHYSASEVTWQITIGLFISAILIVFLGAWTDRVNKKYILFFLSVCTLSFAYPIFSFYEQHIALFVPIALSVFLQTLAWGTIPATLAELFPTKIRYSGIALSYNLAFAFFAGLAPFVALLLIHYTGLLASPSYYLLFTGCLGLIGSLI